MPRYETHDGREFDMDIRITPDHFIPVGYCAKGARRWFAEHNLDFRDFLAKGGWPLSKFGFVDGALIALYDLATTATKEEADGWRR